MLRELFVRRLAVIEDLHVAFGPGLNVLTGETGAGKSILVNAIGLALGWRATTDMIRTGCEDAEVDALFEPKNPHTAKTLTDMEIAPGDEVLVRRVIQNAGRNTVRLNDTAVTLAGLRGLGETLLNLYSQHEAQGLMRPEYHLEVLDEYAGLTADRLRVGEMFAALKQLNAELADLQRRENEREARAGYLRFVIEEIDAAAIRDKEDETLITEHKVLQNAEALTQLAAVVSQELYDREEGSIAERAGELLRRVDAKSALDERLTPMADSLRELVAVADDLAGRCRDYAESLNHDPGRLARIDERLNALRELKKKYGGSLEAVLQTRDDAEKELEGLQKLAGRIAALEKQRSEAAKQLNEAAKELSAARKKSAKKLAREVESELADLDMPGTKLVVSVENLAGGGIELAGLRIDETGPDQVEFLISPNVGEQPRALARIASGGELSRIMLAVKRVLSRHFPVPTLIFDEIDAGVGGAQAERLGRKLQEVAREHQVLCITHLPQIAAMADRHYVVVKRVEKGRTRTEVELLDDKGREAELARMLGGEKITAATRAAARELLTNGTTRQARQ